MSPPLRGGMSVANKTPQLSRLGAECRRCSAPECAGVFIFTTDIKALWAFCVLIHIRPFILYA